MPVPMLISFANSPTTKSRTATSPPPGSPTRLCWTWLNSCRKKRYPSISLPTTGLSKLKSLSASLATKTPTAICVTRWDATLTAIRRTFLKSGPPKKYSYRKKTSPHRSFLPLAAASSLTRPTTPIMSIITKIPSNMAAFPWRK